MKLQTHGIDTLKIEVSSIDSHGFWVFVKGKEYFLSYKDYPWFKNVNICDIINVELLHESHLYWASLDVDLDLRSIEDPASTPLIYH